MHDTADTNVRATVDDRPRRAAGFTLMELMIVIAIVAILASVALPQYRTYAQRSRFAEVVLSVTPYRGPSEIAVQAGRVTNEDGLDAGMFGIPPNVVSGEAVGAYVDSVSMENGVITAVGTDAVDNAVYSIRGRLARGGLVWTELDTVANACQSKGLC